MSGEVNKHVCLVSLCILDMYSAGETGAVSSSLPVTAGDMASKSWG